VSRSLLFECDPIDQPAATDPVERSTWCSMQVWVGERCVSRMWVAAIQSERKSLYLPAFSIAEWLVRNWWSLLNELCTWETVPAYAFNAAQRRWLKRHCLRSADSSLMLPALCVYHDGQSLRAEWQPDPEGSMPNMPGEFIVGGAEPLESSATEISLAQFIDTVLDRAGAANDRRVDELREQWRVIEGADSEEQAFCTLAGRMGLDPYDSDEMTDDLARFLEQSFSGPDDPLVRDLTEVAGADSIVQQWSWLSSVATDLKLGSNPVDLSFGFPSRGSLPPQFGYKLARLVRAAADLSLESPLNSVESVAGAVTGRRLRIEDRNHIPGQGIRAIVGRSETDGEIVAAGPRAAREDSQRFLSARSLYHALVTTGTSRRLVTDAYSWDQKASRAFAAELIAPQQALACRVTGPSADSSQIELLGREFRASTIVIEKQLENAGVSLSYE
jgi:hypothetical protein